MVCMYFLAMAASASASTIERKSALFDTLNLINEWIKGSDTVHANTRQTHVYICISDAHDFGSNIDLMLHLWLELA